MRFKSFFWEKRKLLKRIKLSGAYPIKEMFVLKDVHTIKPGHKSTLAVPKYLSPNFGKF